MLRCLAHSMSRLTAVTMEVTSGVCPWVKDDDGNDQTFEEYVKKAS